MAGSRCCQERTIQLGRVTAAYPLSPWLLLDADQSPDSHKDPCSSSMEPTRHHLPSGRYLLPSVSSYQSGTLPCSHFVLCRGYAGVCVCGWVWVCSHILCVYIYIYNYTICIYTHNIYIYHVYIYTICIYIIIQYVYIYIQCVYTQYVYIYTYIYIYTMCIYTICLYICNMYIYIIYTVHNYIYISSWVGTP